MKKIFSILLAAAVCMSTVTAFAGEYYSDVDDGAYYANAVERLYDFGVMRGYEDGTFRPERVVTRAEAAALMCAARNVTKLDWIPEWNENRFSDVDENH